jgi:hypothetical protein
MMKHLKTLMLAAVFSLAGCHGDTITETVGGTVIGLQSGNTVTLLDNLGDPVTVKQNGSFTFPTALDVGTEYVVSVGTQPDGETCTVENEIGVIEENIGNVSSVVVNCISTVSSSDDVSGTVTGLGSGTLTLTNNGVDNLAITNPNGASVLAWAFAQALPIGTSYQIAILSQPTGQTCNFVADSSGSTHTTGTVSNTAAIPQIAISCK